MDKLIDLIGTTVESIWVEEGEATLVLQTDAGACTLVVEGDCCSTSWFADFLGVDTLLGQTVLEVEETAMPDEDPDNGARSRQSEDQLYGYRFLTLRGYADLIFRNSSNGYYGGWMSVTNDPPSGKLAPITTDWQAQAVSQE